MDGILREIYDLPGIYTFLTIAANGFIIYIIYLKNGLIIKSRMRNF